MPQRLEPIDDDIRPAAKIIGVFLPSPGTTQPRLRVVVLPRREMGLCAPFDDNESERNSQHRAAESGAETPVVDDAFGAVVGVVLEVDVAAAGAPDGTHAVAVLVGADHLRYADVGQPAGITDFEEAEEQDFPSVPAGEGLPGLKKFANRRLKKLFPASGLLMREPAIESGENASDEVLFWDYAFGHQPPDQSFNGEAANGDYVEDNITTTSTAKTYRRGKVGNDERPQR